VCFPCLHAPSPLLLHIYLWVTGVRAVANSHPARNSRLGWSAGLPFIRKNFNQSLTKHYSPGHARELTCPFFVTPQTSPYALSASG
jgi:hypothetical protein